MLLEVVEIGALQERMVTVDASAMAKGIAASRLTPAGVAMLAPKGPDDSEDGRAKNRRVELVRRRGPGELSRAGARAPRAARRRAVAPP